MVIREPLHRSINVLYVHVPTWNCSQLDGKGRMCGLKRNKRFSDCKKAFIEAYRLRRDKLQYRCAHRARKRKRDFKKFETKFEVYLFVKFQRIKRSNIVKIFWVTSTSGSLHQSVGKNCQNILRLSKAGK